MGENDLSSITLPVAIVGAGPVGLSAAAHLATYEMPFVVLEAGEEVGAAVRQWGHVRTFSPWRYNIDGAARRLLQSSGWQPPAEEELPTGHEIVDRYLAPLAEHSLIKPHLRLGTKVTSIGRKDYDKVKTVGRHDRPFEIGLADGTSIEVRAVIDASGTWNSPNPIGSGGNRVKGEESLGDRIAYGIPDVIGREKFRYRGQRVLVVGSGHSAINVVLDLLDLQLSDPATKLAWSMRRENVSTVFGGEEADALPARGALGALARDAIASKRLTLLAPFRISEISAAEDGVTVSGLLGGRPFETVADEIIVATGFRPHLEMLREIRLGLDPWLEAAEQLAPLIDPNLHSCGTVRPHGANELAHPEKDFFMIGMKSYGRAPSFLMATGYEQARSVAAWLAGDFEAAERVDLDLPETGVCSAPADASGADCCGSRDEAPLEEASGGCGCGSSEPKETVSMSITTGRALAVAASNQSKAPAEPSGCCGGPAPTGVDACCVKDADSKAAGESGCGCGSAPKATSAPKAAAAPCCG